MKDQHDKQTADLLPMPPRRGRPATGHAKSGAERMRQVREREARRRDDALAYLCELIQLRPDPDPHVDQLWLGGAVYGMCLALQAVHVLDAEQCRRAREWGYAARDAMYKQIHGC